MATDKIRVFGTSMEPIIRSGALLTIKKSAHYEVGDIVCFRGKGLRSLLLTYCHRIISVDRRRKTFTAKGDNRMESSPFETDVPLSHIQAKVML